VTTAPEAVPIEYVGQRSFAYHVSMAQVAAEDAFGQAAKLLLVVLPGG
jgi:hypothetical protein